MLLKAKYINEFLGAAQSLRNQGYLKHHLKEDSRLASDHTKLLISRVGLEPVTFQHKTVSEAGEPSQISFSNKKSLFGN